MNCGRLNLGDFYVILKQMKLLYVEDEIPFRDKLMPMLSRRFKEIIVADNGKEGLERYHPSSIDIVLSDIRMPIMNGLEMAQEIKKINPKAIIIFATAHNENEFLMEAIELGCHGFILKPINLDNFENTLKRAVSELILDANIEQQRRLLCEEMRFKSLSLLLHNIAHYWRQPLTSAMLTLDNMNFLYQEGSLTPQTAQSMTDRGEKALENLSQTIEFFSQLYQNNDYSSHFNLQETILKIITILEPGFESHNIIFETYFSTNQTLYLPYNHFCNVIVELFVNAFEAYLKASTPQTKHIIAISLNATPQGIEMSISDHAGGLSQHIQKHLFEPYITTKAPTKEAGLGLFSVKTMVERFLHGTISYKALEKGSCFTITLPRLS